MLVKASLYQQKNITYQLYGKTEIPVKKSEMVRTVPFGKFKKIWAVV